MLQRPLLCQANASIKRILHHICFIDRGKDNKLISDALETFGNQLSLSVQKYVRMITPWPKRCTTCLEMNSQTGHMSLRLNSWFLN